MRASLLSLMFVFVWVASPSVGDTNTVTSVNYKGDVSPNHYFNNSFYSNTIGFRPLVSLKSDIQLQKNADGTYTIL